jgi:hypothetical protein
VRHKLEKSKKEVGDVAVCATGKSISGQKYEAAEGE